MTLRLVVSDMVGTTIHAGAEVPRAFRDAFRTEGIDLPDEEIGRVRGRSKRDAISTLLSTHGGGLVIEPERIEAVYARFRSGLRAAYRSSARAIPGAEVTLRRLKERAVDVVLTTGLDGETAGLLLEILGWDGLGLSGVVTGDDVERGRPSPDLIHAAMRRVGVRDPGSVLVVGDTTADLEAAAVAGVGWSVGVLTGAHTRSDLETRPSNALLDSIAELPDWIERAGLLGTD